MPIHIYYMAPLAPSNTQARATTLCKEKVPPENTATSERKATCSECVTRARYFLSIADVIAPNKPDHAAYLDYRALFLALLPEEVKNAS